MRVEARQGRCTYKGNTGQSPRDNDGTRANAGQSPRRDDDGKQMGWVAGCRQCRQSRVQRSQAILASSTGESSSLNSEAGVARQGQWRSGKVRRRVTCQSETPPCSCSLWPVVAAPMPPKHARPRHAFQSHPHLKYRATHIRAPFLLPVLGLSPNAFHSSREQCKQRNPGTSCGLSDIAA